MRGAALPAEEALRRLVALDVRFHDLKGDVVVTTKDRAFRELVRVLEESGVRYAVIGGVAVQLWRSEPRTTLDIDIAVTSYEDVPRRALELAGFRLLARHEHSENWVGPDDTPLQFTADPEFGPLIENAVLRSLQEGQFRIASALDLVRAKLKAARDGARRRSKRLQDLADAQALVEDDPALREKLSEAEREQLSSAL